MSTQPTYLRLVTEEGEPEPSWDLSTQEGFAHAYKRWSPYVAGVGYKILGERELVQELVQEVFVQLFEQRAKIREPHRLKSWLTTVSARTAFRMLRKRKALTFFGLSETPTYEHLSMQEANTEHEVLLRQVFELLERVAVKDRVAWSLRYLQGEKLEEVAEACECSLATVKRRIARVNEFLRREGVDEQMA